MGLNRSKIDHESYIYGNGDKYNGQWKDYEING